MFKNVFIAFVTSLVLTTANAQILVPSDADSKVTFVIKNMGLDVDGTLKGLSGKMVFDPKKLLSSIFDITVDVNTISTGIAKRDAHLKKDDFFNAPKYGTIGIKTTALIAKSATTYTAKAILTMHGVSKNIQFDFVAKPIAVGYQFTGSFVINRLDWSIGGNSMIMGDNVTVKLDIVGRK